MYGSEVRVAKLGPLSVREAEAVLWSAEGKTAWEAGTILGITSATLSQYVASAAEKLHATNKAHLITKAFVAGILVPMMAKAAVLFMMLAVLSNMDDHAVRVRRARTRRGREDYVAAIYSSTAAGSA